MSPQSKANTNEFEDNTQKMRDDINDHKEILATKYIGTDYSYKHQIKWKNAIAFLIMHLITLWGIGIIITGGISLKTYLWVFLSYIVAGEGITIGAHRLFAHKTFKASPVLKVAFIIGQTVAGQNSIFIWCRDHRLHHRYSDTDADPHNSKRGFFFSHIGWLMMKKHPYVASLGRKIDMSDLQADWMVMFQYKYYYYIYFIFGVFIPFFVPYYYFGEKFLTAIITCCTRYVIQLNVTWLVNSAAHLYGTRPYDKKLQPVESWFVSFLTIGEGWHNYHHAFPWDYKAAELSMHFNASASFIRFFERIGLAYDLKTATPEMVSRRVIKTGDGTHWALGNEKYKNAVTAIGILHPLNPSYNVTYTAPNTVIDLPLSEENYIFLPQTVNKIVELHKYIKTYQL